MVVVVADGVDQLVHEVLRGHIHEPRLRSFSLDEVPDGMHQVGLPQPDSPVDKEGVIGFGRLFRNGYTCSVSKLVAEAHHKPIEGIFTIQAAKSGIGTGLLQGCCPLLFIHGLFL